MNYTISLNGTKRHIIWCDDNWYEASIGEYFGFTIEEAERIGFLMAKHFQYHLKFIGEDGSVVDFNYFDRKYNTIDKVKDKVAAMIAEADNAAEKKNNGKRFIISLKRK